MLSCIGWQVVYNYFRTRKSMIWNTLCAVICKICRFLRVDQKIRVYCEISLIRRVIISVNFKAWEEPQILNLMKDFHIVAPFCWSQETWSWWQLQKHNMLLTYLASYIGWKHKQQTLLHLLHHHISKLIQSTLNARGAVTTKISTQKDLRSVSWIKA